MVAAVAVPLAVIAGEAEMPAVQVVNAETSNVPPAAMATPEAAFNAPLTPRAKVPELMVVGPV